LQAKLSLPSTRWPPTQHHRAARTVVVRRRQEGAAAEQAERVLRNLTRQLDHDAAGVSASILEGLDEMLTVIRLGLPDGLRRSLGCTNAIESLMAVVRQVCCNGKRWRDARMALRWTAPAMLEAEKRLPPFEGSQAAANSANRLAAPSASSAR
jgi:putative transposase